MSDLVKRPTRRSPSSKVQQTEVNKQNEEEKRDQKKRDGFNIASMLVLLYFSTAMVVLPLGVYFVIYWYIIKSTTLAALGAVVMVQLIVAAFIYKAWHDEKTEASQHKTKDKKHS